MTVVNTQCAFVDVVTRRVTVARITLVACARASSYRVQRRWRQIDARRLRSAQARNAGVRINARGDSIARVPCVTCACKRAHRVAAAGQGVAVVEVNKVHSLMSEQVTPLPVYPPLQLQVNEPGVSVHEAESWQL